jgi:hypothetical protein
MALSIHFMLMLIAVICLLLAAIGRPSMSPLSLGWLGLFFWALDILTSAAR